MKNNEMELVKQSEIVKIESFEIVELDDASLDVIHGGLELNYKCTTNSSQCACPKGIEVA